MEEKLITFETAKSAKQYGFDEITDVIYDTYNRPISTKEITPYQRMDNFNSLKHSDGNNNFVSAPTQAFLQKWLREVHNINVYCVCRVCEWTYWIDKISPLSQESTTYEKALEEGLREGLKLIK